MRFCRLLCVGAGLLALAACGDSAETGETAGALDQTSETSQEGGEAQEQSYEGATPNEQRVATIGLLNKRNNVSQDFEIRPGEVVEEGPVIIRVSTCERTAPWEMVKDTGAFVQLDVLERGQSEHRRVFSGWLYKESPSLNVVEHPIYDVWVKDCAMRFPGEEPLAPASDSEEG